MAKSTVDKALEALGGLDAREFRLALEHYTQEYAVEFAWPESYTKASLKKLDAYIVSLNDRDVRNYDRDGRN